MNAAPNEVAGLRETLIAGKVDGSTYEGESLSSRHDRECSALLLRRDSRPPAQLVAPAERFCLTIRRGDTPENSQAAAIVLGWIDEWIAAHPTSVQLVGATQ